MFYDLALDYDTISRRCDLALDGDCDFAIDESAITPILMSVGLDRRADPDDELPIGRSAFLTPASFSERRGGPTDALDPRGDLSGSRCWLLDRAKETEPTRALYAFWLAESLAWAERITGNAAEITVEWSAPQRLAYRVFVAENELSLTRSLGEI